MNKNLNVQASYIVTVDQAVTFDAEIAVATAKNERKRKVNSYKMTQGTDSGLSSFHTVLDRNGDIDGIQGG